MRATRNGFVVVALAALACAPLVGQDKVKSDGGKKAPGKIVIKVQRKAELYVDDKRVPGKGTERTFTTPPLEPGKTYTYSVSSVRDPNNYTTIIRTRKVTVTAGGTTKLDLSGPDDPKQPDEIKVRYVPTPQGVAEKMLEIAKVGKDDVVFDIGCGDGRLVITAVKKHGAKKGIGVDIDPDRIKESVANAKEAGVSDKVTFRQEDALKVKGLEEATVVCLYMSRALMDQLHPIFKKRLKPGTRIVSHRFTMKGWTPDKTIIHKDKGLDDEDEEFRLHLWTVPAAKTAGDKK